MKRLILTIALCAALLFGINAATASVREAHAQEALLEQMQLLLPGSTAFTEEVYEGEDDSIAAAWKAANGYVIQVVTAGYAGDIELLVGVSNSGHVMGLVIRDMEETYGLGAQALTDWKFLCKFLNTSGDAAVGENIDAISGATVTSKAIARGVNSAVGFVTGADTSSGATSWGG